MRPTVGGGRTEEAIPHPSSGSPRLFARMTLGLMILLMLGVGAGAGLLASPPKRVELATLVWEPYIGPSMPNQGYVREIVVEAYRAMGYEVGITFYPWARALAVARSGKVDGLFPEYFEPLRRVDFDYSDSFPGGPVGFMARKDSGIRFPSDPRVDLATTLRQMKSYRFGVVRGYVNTKAFDEADFLEKDETVTDEQNIQKLLARRVDLIFIDQYVARHLLETRIPQGKGELTFLEPPLETKPLYIAFSKRAPDQAKKREDFNAGLDRIRKSGALQAILRKHGF